MFTGRVGSPDLTNRWSVSSAKLSQSIIYTTRDVSRMSPKDTDSVGL